MPETLKFKLAAVAANEVPQAKIRVYDSADGLTGFALADEKIIAELTPDIDGWYIWASAADATKFHQLRTVSEDDVEKTCMILPPRPADPALCTIMVNTFEILGVAKAGESVTVTPVGEHIVIDGRVIAKEPKTFYSDANGNIAFNVLQGLSLRLTSSFLGDDHDLDTTGTASIDLANLQE